MEVFDWFQQLSHETRLRMVSLLDENELCVCELEEILSIKQVNISKHLNKLKKAGIVFSRREKQRVFYYLSEAFAKEPAWLEIIRLNRQKHPVLKKDYGRLMEHEKTKDNNIYVCNVFKKESLS